MINKECLFSSDCIDCPLVEVNVGFIPEICFSDIKLFSF